jgi:hypothetical protein
MSINAKNNPVGRGMKGLQDLMNQYRQRQPNTEGIRFETEADRVPLAEDDESGIDANERRMLKVLQFCLLAAMAYFCVQNIRPYIGIVDAWIFAWTDTDIFRMVSTWPLIGWALNGGIAIVNFILATLLWLALQLLELLPSIMMDSPRFLLSSLAALRNWQKIKSENGDSELAKKLKNQYNAIPQQSIERANLARAGAYILDALICIAYFQPIEGGLSNLGLVFTAGAWDYIDWAQVVNILATLFAVELIYWVYKLVLGIARTHFQNN